MRHFYRTLNLLLLLVIGFAAIYVVGAMNSGSYDFTAWKESIRNTVSLFYILWMIAAFFLA